MKEILGLMFLWGIGGSRAESQHAFKSATGKELERCEPGHSSYPVVQDRFSPSCSRHDSPYPVSSLVTAASSRYRCCRSGGTAARASVTVPVYVASPSQPSIAFPPGMIPCFFILDIKIQRRTSLASIMACAVMTTSCRGRNPSESACWHKLLEK